jgi:thiol:disulfide interchange protein
MRIGAALPAWLLAMLFSFSALPAGAQGGSIYPPPGQARADIAAALENAGREHKRVILDFGGDWCTDCRVLDLYFHDPSNAALLAQNFLLVHVNVGHIDENLDLGRRYRVPLERGVPALAVLSPSGRLLYSQRNHEFSTMRRLDSSALTAFLMRWKLPAGSAACAAAAARC